MLNKKNEYKKIGKIQEEKHFLIRKIANKNSTDITADKERIAECEAEVANAVKEVLAEEYASLKDEAKHIKKTISSDGDMKRQIALSLISILEPVLTSSDLKGVFRQGYKIMRTKC